MCPVDGRDGRKAAAEEALYQFLNTQFEEVHQVYWDYTELSNIVKQAWTPNPQPNRTCWSPLAIQKGDIVKAKRFRRVVYAQSEVPGNNGARRC